MSASNARNTFGIIAYVYNSTYVAIGGLFDINPPVLVADPPVDITNHSSAVWATGYPVAREFIPAGTVTVSDVALEVNEDTADAAQIFIISKVGTQQKFKFLKPPYLDGTGTTVTPTAKFFNAIIVSVIEGKNPLNGKGALTINLKPTGAQVTS